MMTSLKLPFPNFGRKFLSRFRASIGTKIVLPYLILTLGVAGVGGFIVIRLVTGSWQERFHNQLLDTGRVVSESMVLIEEERLETLRLVIGTNGVADSLAAGDREALADLVPQIIANSNSDAVELLDKNGQEVFGWQRPPNQFGAIGEERSGADFGPLKDVRMVLSGVVDEYGAKRILLSQTSQGLMLFTIGPVYLNDQLVGAAMVGTYIEEIVPRLAEASVARVTLYDPQGTMLNTSFGQGQQGLANLLQEPRDQYSTIRTLLSESPERHPVVVSKADDEVPLRRVQVLGQEYSLAYGDWRIRGQSLGLFSVALPTRFIVSTASTSRNVLGVLFSVATIAVFAIGFNTAQRIMRPLQRLVQTSTAVTQGDLSRRTGIQRSDEIGHLAHSFDAMTERLVERNRQLLEQASKLEAILDSTADGIIVLDQYGVIITSNPAAQQIFDEVSSDFLSDILRELPSQALLDAANDADVNTEQALELARLRQAHRYEVGGYVLSALMAPVKTPELEVLGTVIALRDITREAEAEQLKDGFITNISHELRTPLTAIQGNSELLQITAGDQLSDRQARYIDRIVTNTEKLAHHINEIIEISQIQGGSLRLNKDKLNLSVLVLQIAEKWRKSFEEKDLTLQLHLPESELWVNGDQQRLVWAIDNLLSNAERYTLQGGTIVRLYHDNDEARLDVTDTGVGIAVSDQPYLFTRFFRATPHQEMYEVSGVGLGLFITRSLAELHGGRAWAESEINVGSTFSLSIPLCQST